MHHQAREERRERKVTAKTGQRKGNPSGSRRGQFNTLLRACRGNEKENLQNGTSTPISKVSKSGAAWSCGTVVGERSSTSTDTPIACTCITVWIVQQQQYYCLCEQSSTAVFTSLSLYMGPLSNRPL